MAPVMLSGAYLQRAGVFSLQQPMPPGIKPPQHCASPEPFRLDPDARPVSPADEIRRIAPLLDALSDQMHRVSIDSFQPETQRYALKRGVGYLNDIQGFPDPALYPDIAEADCRLVVMHSAQRDGIATRTGHLRPEDARAA